MFKRRWQVIILGANIVSSKAAKVAKTSMQAWIIGLTLSLISSSASLVNLRAQSRRFALRADIARKDEKGPDAAADEAERRKQGRALLAYVQYSLTGHRTYTLTLL